jgi:hypothetical protein
MAQSYTTNIVETILHESIERGTKGKAWARGAHGGAPSLETETEHGHGQLPRLQSKTTMPKIATGNTIQWSRIRGCTCTKNSSAFAFASRGLLGPVVRTIGLNLESQGKRPLFVSATGPCLENLAGAFGLVWHEMEICMGLPSKV